MALWSDGFTFPEEVEPLLHWVVLSCPRVLLGRFPAASWGGRVVLVVVKLRKLEKLVQGLLPLGFLGET